MTDLSHEMTSVYSKHFSHLISSHMFWFYYLFRNSLWNFQIHVLDLQVTLWVLFDPFKSPLSFLQFKCRYFDPLIGDDNRLSCIFSFPVRQICSGLRAMCSWIRLQYIWIIGFFYQDFLKKVRVYCCYPCPSVRPSVRPNFVSILSHSQIILLWAGLWSYRKIRLKTHLKKRPRTYLMTTLRYILGCKQKLS